MSAPRSWNALIQALRRQAAVHSTAQSSNPRYQLECPAEHVCAITDAGSLRERNEDCIYISSDTGTLIVADGMGGHAGGALAARLAVKACAQFLAAARAVRESEPTQSETQLRGALAFAHGRLREVQAGWDGQPMGCTLIAAIVQGAHLSLAHIGDVRGYLYSSSRLRQLTEDHTRVGQLVALGLLTEEEARRHPLRNEVLQALGMPIVPEPGCCSVELRAGDRVLLCSDGLWEMLPFERLQASLASPGSVREVALSCVRHANEAGGRDNISVALLQF